MRFETLGANSASLHFDKSELISLIGDIRAGRANGAISTLQAVANRSGDSSREAFEQAKYSGRAYEMSQAVAADPVPGIDGTLKDAHIFKVGAVDVCSGAIYGDRKARFKDGERVTTSRIVSGPDANGIIRTRNSVYRVELAEAVPA